MRFPRIAASFAAGLTFLGACAAMAQAPAADGFDLGSRYASAAITMRDSGTPTSAAFYDVDGNLISRGAPVSALIRMAYQVPESRIVDGPEWVYAKRLYDIDTVRPPPELVASDNTQMLRAFLADRFQLELTETAREMPVLALEFVEATPALQRVETPQLKLAPGQTEGLYMRGTVTTGEPGAPVSIEAELTLAAVASALSRELERDVVDMTGLEGIWGIKFAGVVPGGGPGLRFSLLLERLGLRLTERTLTLDVLAITRVERPKLDE